MLVTYLTLNSSSRLVMILLHPFDPLQCMSRFKKIQISGLSRSDGYLAQFSGRSFSVKPFQASDSFEN